ncbi:type II glyceraldehyde-3-phosphate dehydrogenase [Bradyrhizobium sp. SZCCHNRI20481]|uniref:type II glyceraldehyde-3-phosphate dehydrogenase n=1 Tax=Bradyrhizobium sp. SZCCHNRI20481 TaxID=3057286 RepID=UPI002916699F|nr:type II glyceraldehyde-3-phosphate dehydrogenase [Bradyrhizobium sp. SZCCHNRI20481]
MTGQTDRHIGKKRIGIVGLGTIGRRVATAAMWQPDMTVSGFAAPRMSPYLRAFAHVPTYSVGAPFEGAADGGLEAFLDGVDLVVDCAPRGSAEARKDHYVKAGIPAVFQGGEGQELADISFCASVNFAQARGLRSVRVVSCNTTGVARVFAVLLGIAGAFEARLVLVRSATDGDKAHKGDAVGLSAEHGLSHHAEDLRAFWPTLPITSLAIKAPTNRGHLISAFLRFQTPPDRGALLAALAATPRILVADGAISTRRLREYSAGLGRCDCPSVVVWEAGLVVSGHDVAMTLGIHMESIVIPDTIDACRVLLNPGIAAPDSMAITDRTLAVPRGRATSHDDEERGQPC